MLVILSALVWQDAGIIGGGEASLVLLIQHDYFFLECISLEKMYKMTKAIYAFPATLCKIMGCNLKGGVAEMQWDQL